MRMRGRRGGLGVAWMAALAICLALPAQSWGVPFGANLGRAPDSTTTCGDFGFSSCSADFTDVVNGESVFPPVGRGVINRVRVRVGPVTGPMQVMVEQALRKDNPVNPGNPTYACCQALRASQVFTPRPNSVTAVNVRLPVRQDISPDPASGYYVDQHLALSVLASNVPIPASANASSGFSLWFPAWKVGDERCCPYGGLGATILISADWQRCSGAKSAGATGAKKRKKGKKKKRKKKSACGKKKKRKKKKKKKRLLARD
jgi:hypothetical protein